MGDLTIRNLDDDLVRRLETRAAANGRSLDEEIRAALERVAREDSQAPIKNEENNAPSETLSGETSLPKLTNSDEDYRAHLLRVARLGDDRRKTRLTEAEIEERMKRLSAISKKPEKPFDLKAFSDELYDYLD